MMIQNSPQLALLLALLLLTAGTLSAVAAYLLSGKGMAAILFGGTCLFSGACFYLALFAWAI